MRAQIDKSVLERIIRDAPGKAEQMVQKMAQDTEIIAKNSMTANGPAPAGLPPAVDTGNLKNSIMAAPGVSRLTWLLLVGADYGVHLEYGTVRMAARPFVLPAVERMVSMMPPDLMVKVVT